LALKQCLRMLHAFAMQASSRQALSALGRSRGTLDSVSSSVTPMSLLKSSRDASRLKNRLHVRLRALVLLMSTLSCSVPGRRLPPTTSPPRSISSEQLAQSSVGFVRALAMQLSRVRGLRRPGAPTVAILDEQDFKRAAQENIESQPSYAATGKRFELFFGVWTKAHASMAEPQITAFWDSQAMRLVLRGRDTHQLTEPQVIWTIVHELEHFFQQSTMSRCPPTASLDATLAWRALAEGDAEVSTLALWAVESGLPVMSTVSRSSATVRQRYISTVPHTRTEDLRWLEYQAGPLFVIDLFEREGFELVDHALIWLAESTSQILHPDKFLAHQHPIEVVLPKLPASLELLGEDTAGEWIIGDVFAPCTGLANARAIAADWAGDRFYVARDASKNTVMIWKIMWDSTAAAERFGQAFTAVSSCVSQMAMASVQIRKHDNSILVLVGLPSAAAERFDQSENR
jgi:hypothetical protein